MDVKTHDGTANFVPGTIFDIHHISVEELATLGMEEIAFVKPVMTDRGIAFAIHAADGTPMAIASDSKLAQAAIIQHDMQPKLVHWRFCAFCDCFGERDLNGLTREIEFKDSIGICIQALGVD